MTLLFFFASARAARGADGYLEAEQPAADRMEVTDADIAMGLVEESKGFFHWPSWLRQVGW